tara:strand:+ start:1374 stop:1727 length:354 start_codon:yes stop_codon:yes gene_type:complete
MDIKESQLILRKTIEYFDIIVSLIVLIIFSYNIILTSYTFFLNNSPLREKIDKKIHLIESISLSLSFILCIEILKIFYIKHYKQLIIVCSLVIIKLLISFFINHEIKEETKKQKSLS